MKLIITCPCCNEKISLIMESDQVKSVEVTDAIETSEVKISELLVQHNIEFG